MMYGSIYGERKKKRKPFTIKVKRNEWMLAQGKNPFVDKFTKNSKCRVCKRKLIWGDRSYEFDHKNNHEWDNRQENCYLVCRVCHGKATKIVTRKQKDILGGVIGTKRIKRKIGYKKGRKKKPKRKAIKSSLTGQIIGWRKVRSKRKTKKPKKKRKRRRKKSIFDWSGV